MKKLSHLTRISLLLAIFFGVDKLLGILRIIIIGRQFGLSAELDVFNAANNLPDLLFALISGGALAIAFIPVLSETITHKGRESAWRLFSQVANIAFLLTGFLAIIIGILAGPIVRGQLGIAPGFTADQQDLVIGLMRLNLISTLIFSISGLVMAGLQSHQHFLLPALAPLLYDVGQIFGAVILAPEEGLSLAGIQLPAFGLGIEGLVYGVIIGSALHLLIQIPALVKLGFKWIPTINFKDTDLRKVFRLMGPRLVSMAFIQLIFLARDNLASRLPAGSVTALNYGWWIQQVPETLIGTAIATALLPTLSEHIAAGDQLAFKKTVERSLRVMIALSFPVAVLLSFTTLPLIQVAFGFTLDSSRMIMWATQGYLIGLLGHMLVEVGVRAFYARKNARIPMIVSGAGLIIYIGLAVVLMRPLAAGGIALANSISYSIQGVILVVILNQQVIEKMRLNKSLLRGVLAALASGLSIWLILNVLPIPLSPVFLAIIALIAGSVIGAIPVRREIRTLIQL